MPTQTEASHRVNPQSYTTVPDRYKFENHGHYQQTPAGFGLWEGEWWSVSPFGQEPWEVARRKTEPQVVEQLPDGFQAIFGPRPEKADFNTRRAWKHDVIVWEQDKKNFVQAGDPPWTDMDIAVDLQKTADIFQAWNVGSPVYYEHKSYGWMAMFLDSELDEFQMNAHTTVYHTHLVIANYQVQLIQEGIQPSVVHPLIKGVAVGLGDDE